MKGHTDCGHGSLLTGKSLIIPAQVVEPEKNLPLVTPKKEGSLKRLITGGIRQLPGEIERTTLLLGCLILDRVILLSDRVPELIIVRG